MQTQCKWTNVQQVDKTQCIKEKCCKHRKQQHLIKRKVFSWDTIRLNNRLAFTVSLIPSLWKPFWFSEWFSHICSPLYPVIPDLTPASNPIPLILDSVLDWLKLKLTYSTANSPSEISDPWFNLCSSLRKTLAFTLVISFVWANSRLRRLSVCSAISGFAKT